MNYNPEDRLFQPHSRTTKLRQKTATPKPPILLSIPALMPLIALLISKTHQKCCPECLEDLTVNQYYNIRIYETPWKSNFTGFCKAVFNRDGTCCNIGDATKYSTIWLNRIEYEMNLTLMEISNFRSSVQFVGMIEDYIEKNEKKILASKKIEKDELEEFKEILKTYEEGSFNFNYKEKILKEKYLICHGYMTNIRKNALCMRCSGVGDKYWNKKEHRYMINNRTCRKILTKCVEVFSYLSEITTFYHRLSQLRSAAHGDNIEGELVKGMSKKTIDLIKICALDETLCLNNHDLMDLFCRQITVGERNPDIEGEVATLKDGDRVVNRIVDGLDIGKRRRILHDDHQLPLQKYGFLMTDPKGADLAKMFPHLSVSIEGYHRESDDDFDGKGGGRDGSIDSKEPLNGGGSQVKLGSKNGGWKKDKNHQHDKASFLLSETWWAAVVINFSLFLFF